MKGIQLVLSESETTVSYYDTEITAVPFLPLLVGPTMLIPFSLIVHAVPGMPVEQTLPKAASKSERKTGKA